MIILSNYRWKKVLARSCYEGWFYRKSMLNIFNSRRRTASRRPDAGLDFYSAH